MQYPFISNREIICLLLARRNKLREGLLFFGLVFFGELVDNVPISVFNTNSIVQIFDSLLYFEILTFVQVSLLEDHVRLFNSFFFFAFILILIISKTLQNVFRSKNTEPPEKS